MKRFWIIVTILLLAGVVVCVVRWKAWFQNPPEPEWSGDTISIQFNTFGRENVPNFTYNGIYWENTKKPEIFQMLVLGDVHNGLTHDEWKALAKRHPQLDCYAQLGDFVERGYHYYNQWLFREIKGTSFENLPLINVPGNHEYLKGLKRTLPDYWTQTFPQPHNGPEDFVGTTYYVDFEDLRVIALNTNGLQHLRDYTRVNTWLKKTIKGAESRFVVVLMHHPVHSCAEGRQNMRIGATFLRPLKKADLVFAGHDHNYVRRLPFICTNAAGKPHKFKPDSKDECEGENLRVYEIVSVYSDTLYLQTRILDSGELFDEVKIPSKQLP